MSGWRTTLGFLTALCSASVTAAPAVASDYAHTCRSADGAYEMNDDVLSVAGATDGATIRYTTLSETTLSERRGYCLARGQQYGFEARTYVKRIRFAANGQTVEIDMLCELASDGLPAAYTCEREVVTHERQGAAGRQPAPAPSGATLWDHNGSRMALQAEGKRRRFVYVTPRPGMLRAGAKPGDAVFEGERDGRKYRGTAFIFTPRCGRMPYAVAGSVSADDRRVELHGRAPGLDDRCRPVGGRDDTLVFELMAER